MTSLIEQARATVAQYGMFAGGGKVVVGLSGGADSCALLHFLRFGLSLPVTACHLNHGLRGEESERDERFCRSLCERWAVPLFVRRVEVARLSGSVEEAGRAARYRFFAEVCAETGADWVATAHTRTDNLETMLWNLVRGAGARGLSGIPPVRMLEVTEIPGVGQTGSDNMESGARLTSGFKPGRLVEMLETSDAGRMAADEMEYGARLISGFKPGRTIEASETSDAGRMTADEVKSGARPTPSLRLVGRPLLECSREQVEAYCREHRIEYVTDSSNFNDSYTRNRIRRNVVPALREISPAAEESAARAAAILRDEDEYLAAQAADALAAATRADGWEAAELAALPPALGRRALALLLRESGAAPDFALVERARGMLATPFARWELAPGRFFQVRDGRAAVREETEPVPPYEIELYPDGEWDLGFGILRTKICEKMPFTIPEKVQKNLLYLALDYDRINRKLTARSRRAGDAASFAGRGGTKTLKKAFNEAKLSAFEKSSRPVLADEAGVVAVPGFGPDARCALSPGTRRALLVTWEPRPSGEDPNPLQERKDKEWNRTS